MAYLTIWVGNKASAPRELSGAVTLGRAPDCDIAILDGALSRRHCSIEPTPQGGWDLVDLESTNGTFARGRRVARHALQDGEAFRAGPVTARFHAGAIEPGAAPEPMPTAADLEDELATALAETDGDRSSDSVREEVAKSMGHDPEVADPDDSVAAVALTEAAVPVAAAAPAPAAPPQPAAWGARRWEGSLVPKEPAVAIDPKAAKKAAAAAAKAARKAESANRKTASAKAAPAAGATATPWVKVERARAPFAAPSLQKLKELHVPMPVAAGAVVILLAASVAGWWWSSQPPRYSTGAAAKASPQPPAKVAANAGLND